MEFEPFAHMEWAKLAKHGRLNLGRSGVPGLTLGDLGLSLEGIEINGDHPYGYPPLLEAIAARHGARPENVIPSIGTSMAIFHVCAALLGPGDTAAVERPAYGQMRAVPKVLGAEVVRFDRTLEEGYPHRSGSPGRADPGRDEARPHDQPPQSERRLALSGRDPRGRRSGRPEGGLGLHRRGLSRIHGWGGRPDGLRPGRQHHHRGEPDKSLRPFGPALRLDPRPESAPIALPTGPRPFLRRDRLPVGADLGPDLSASRRDQGEAPLRVGAPAAGRRRRSSPASRECPGSNLQPASSASRASSGPPGRATHWPGSSESASIRRSFRGRSSKIPAASAWASESRRPSSRRGWTPSRAPWTSSSGRVEAISRSTIIPIN